MTTLVLSKELHLDNDLCALSWCLHSKVIACLNWALKFSPPPLEVET